MEIPVTVETESGDASQGACPPEPRTTPLDEPQEGHDLEVSGKSPEVPGTDPVEPPRPQKPGKYVCDYCGRACAKPSVLKKHIRSHTGERPYPCVPCGFSFKTKSNLYKHRKSHAHSVKAGTLPESYGDFSEGSTESDEDASGDPLLLLDSPDGGPDNTAVKVLIAQKKDGWCQEMADATCDASRDASTAVKQRLALRLSEKRSGDPENNLSLPSQSSKGSTDSGYFSRSESTEHQTAPNANAKSYQEIMFGKCYRPSPKTAAADADKKGVSRVFTQEKDAVEPIRINTRSREPDTDSGTLVRSNSMPTASVVCLTLRGSHSFDERTATGGLRRLRRQAAFEHSAHGDDVEETAAAAAAANHQKHAMELATRKRRKEKREEEDSPGLQETDSPEIRKTSVIQHTNSIPRPEYPYEDPVRSEMAPKLVRQPNIQVPEIRVTVEPDSPEKAPEKEPEKEEFQWPQRSETLAQFPPEKLPPKKKRLRLADIEHSSGESSFESACTSLSRSPSQDSNLSYSSAFEESLRSPVRPDDSGKELLAVPRHEMRRSSSEQAPGNLRCNPETRSASFDYGTLTLTRDVRRRSLIRQESLEVAETAFQQYLVPVRIHTQVPCYGSVTYTSVSRIGVTAATANQIAGVGAEVLDLSAKLKTGIPLSLTSRTISTTNAGGASGGASGGANKRMLSPASSLDLFMEVKRVKEERMFGEIVEELSAVELGAAAASPDADPDSLETAEIATATVPAVSEFPSLRTATGVSWCYLNYTKPSCYHGDPTASVYAAWGATTHNAFPPELSTGAALALLRSRQKGAGLIYTVAAMCQPGAGKLVSSLVLWRQQTPEQRKPELREVDVTSGKKARDASCRGKNAREEWKEREATAGGGGVATATAAVATATRVKIFDGGYKSNEDYVYVRGRGRGKYICEECGIRCKKPSMLKKHIRTHTDVRPYVCRVCNFAFKTKGNLTKHMKSKAHMKKCLELGVTVDDQEHVDDSQSESRTGAGPTTKHQFSDAEDSDGMDEDEVDEDEDEEDDYEGDSTRDSTPRLRSRSSSPQPVSVAVHGYSARRQERDKPLDEDSLTTLSPDHANFLFDPYTSCLLSPGWESPIREPSPSRLRYPSPTTRGRSSPSRWDPSSPLRAGSPGFLSPGSMERAVSPGGAELGGGKPAVRGRQRVVLRAVSPRRGSHQHKGGGDKSRHHARMDAAQRGGYDMETDQRLGSLASVLPASLPQNVLSHLPLHSQQPALTLLPVGPVGGVHLAPPPGPAPTPPSPPISEGSAHPDTPPPGQEDVQTCLKAIAMLKITAEDPQ